MDSSSRGRLYTTLFITITYLAICWRLFGAEEIGDISLRKWGLKPRQLDGVIGILSMHFLHGDLKHIAHNTLSFFVLSSFLFFFYREVAIKVFLWILFIGGTLLWFWGRDGNHIGASLLIYGLASFLFFSGIFRKDENMLRIALVVAFYYGSIVWYVFPVDPNLSWEGHLSGALAGLVFAWYYRGSGAPRRKYQYEIDEEKEAEMERRIAEADWTFLSDTSEESNVFYEYLTDKNPSDDEGKDKTGA
jgi:membrane associated rhomboid family serine protease